MQFRHQLAEGRDLIGIFPRVRAGTSASPLGDLLSQDIVEATDRRIACHNGFPQLPLLFLHLEGKLGLFRLQHNDNLPAA